MAAVADAPYHRTLWTHYQLRQREALDELRARGRQLSGAALNAMGFHEPKKLQAEHERLMSDIRARSGEQPTVDEIRAHALALMMDIQRADDAGAWEMVS